MATWDNLMKCTYVATVIVGSMGMVSAFASSWYIGAKMDSGLDKIKHANSVFETAVRMTVTIAVAYKETS